MAGPAVTAFDFGDLRGEVARRHRPADGDLEPEMRRLTDPAAAVATVHWGRNYLYEACLESADGTRRVVVKQFRDHGLRAALRRRGRGGKAARSWRAALAFEAAGVPTAEPVALIESARPDGPSFFVTAKLDAALEARYLLRAANSGRLAEEFPQVDYGAFLDRLGALLRRMHGARLFHRDLSIGNVLLLGAAEGGAWPPAEEPALAIVDLNRARQRRRPLTLDERTRDLCRLSIFRRADQRRLLAAYWGEVGPLRWSLYQLYHRGFHTKIAAKKRWRRWTGRLSSALRPRRAHPHIPEAEAAAAARDKVVWDPLSDQPHQHASRLEKWGVRLADAPDHLRVTAAFLAAAPRILRRYRALRAEGPLLGRRWNGLGIGVRPHPRDPEALLEALEDLGLRHVLLRLHPWARGHDDEEALARALAERGYELTFTLPQNRHLVRDPARWRGAVEELAARFTPYGRRFQVGQAINRSKWGIWRYGEYLELAAAAAAVLRRHEGVEVLGPAVIDFELHTTAAIVNHPRAAFRFDALASLLYVDRRGAPENRQLGFDTAAKVTLAQAIAETARHCAPRSWITEVNWPLWEGPHSPAGRTVSVDEATQAAYLVRFFVTALATGRVERVFWWQLIARGYGLIAPSPDGRLRRRPGFAALATLARQLDGTRFVGLATVPSPGRLYRFRHDDGREVAVGWSTAGACAVSLPSPVSRVVAQEGDERPVSARGEIVLMPSVQYVHVAAAAPESAGSG